MIPKDNQPPYDAEKIDKKLLKVQFKQPPGVGELPPTRSTLLVGARGSGKTMLLMAASTKTDYTALYGDLRKILNGVSADTGFSGLSFNVRPSEERYLQSKAAALLGLWVVRESLNRNLPVSILYLRKLVPDELSSQVDEDITDEAISLLAEKMSELRPSAYPKVARLDILCMLIDEISQKAISRHKKGLVLLLDRAEEVPFPGLVPVLRLMDQDNSFRAVVACRPGILGSSPNIDPSLPTAGDHFDVRHLGHSPYSDEWNVFQREVLSAWIPESVKALPIKVLHTLLKISRDSLRTALELVYNSSDERTRYNENLSNCAIENLQAQLLDAAQGTLHTLNNDLSVLIRNIRKADGYHLPVALEMRFQGSGEKNISNQLSLLTNNSSYENATKLEQFIRLGLRTWLLSVPHGMRWSPSVQLSQIELNPIYLWKRGDRWGGQ
jgi:hypothetical protein